MRRLSLLVFLAGCGGSVDPQPDTGVQATEPRLGATCACQRTSCETPECGSGLFCKVSVYATDGKGICTRACGSRGQPVNASKPSCPSDFQCVDSYDGDMRSAVDYCFSLR